MIPKLTDEAVSRLPLESGRAELLEEIMTTVAPDRQTEPTPNPTPRRARWLVPLAVAAAVASVASAPLWWGADEADNADKQESPDVSFQAAPDSPGTGYRAVVTAPGWKADYVSQDDKYGGEVSFENGDRSLDITWYPEKTYQSYLTDREHINYPDPPAPGDPVQVLGVAGQLWAYSNTDHTVMREPDQGHWMEFRGGGMDRAAFEELLTHLKLVSLRGVRVGAPVVVRHRRGPTCCRQGDPRRHRGSHRRDRAGRHHPGHAVRRAGPLPAGRRHRRAVRLRLDRRVRGRHVVRGPGACRRGREGHGDLAAVAGAVGDGP